MREGKCPLFNENVKNGEGRIADHEYCKICFPLGYKRIPDEDGRCKECTEKFEEFNKNFNENVKNGEGCIADNEYCKICFRLGYKRIPNEDGRCKECTEKFEEFNKKFHP